MAAAQSGIRAEGHWAQHPLQRARHAGDTFGLTTQATSTQHTVTTLNGQEVGNESRERGVSLDADVVVRAVWESGKPSLSEYTVRSCLTTGENPEEILPAGSVVIVNREAATPEERLTLQGGTLTEEQLGLLRLAISSGSNRQGPDDEIFGTAEPQTVGSSWPANTELMAQDMSASTPISLTADQISGETTFAALENIDGTMCQRLEGRFTIEGGEISGLPPGTSVQSSRLDVEASMLLPVDTSLARLRSGTNMRTHMVMQVPAPDGNTYNVTTDMHNT